MGANRTVVVLPTSKSAKIVKWKVSEGTIVYEGRVILLYDLNTNGDEGGQKRLKATEVGTVRRLIAKEGEILEPGQPLLEIEKGCSHPTVINDLCAECGADLRKQEVTTPHASVPMVHSVPELKVSEEQAEYLGKADEERLLKAKKLVLLVDLDQTLIHTTNDNIPNNIKDVYHFQLYSQHSPWYHTRLRPGTHDFLTHISEFYELHICTFGARNYAHMIAHFLDPDGKFFSHRILSRDECFDPNSKTANLKALFPVGDRLVCIIDDREDVWNYAPNLIHVKPYHFFQHTGDINAPPGLTKRENDESESGFDFSTLVKGITMKKKELKPPKLSSESETEDGELKEAVKFRKSVKGKGKRQSEGKKCSESDSDFPSSESNSNDEKYSSKTTEPKKALTVIKEEGEEVPEKMADETSKSEVSPVESSENSEECVSKGDTTVKEDETAGIEDLKKPCESVNLTESSESVTAITDTAVVDKVNEDSSPTKNESEIKNEGKSVELDSEEITPLEVNEDTSSKILGQETKSNVNEASCNDTSSIDQSIKEDDACEERKMEVDDKAVLSEVKAQENQSLKESSDLDTNKMEIDKNEDSSGSDLFDKDRLELSDSDNERRLLELSSSGEEEKLDSNLGNDENGKRKKKEKRVKFTDEKIESNLVELEETDDYLLYLEEILKTIHKSFYAEYEATQVAPDLKSIIPKVKKQVLAGSYLVFSGIIPTHVELETTRAYMVAVSLGAVVTKEIDENTTHVVAVRNGTAKVNAARRKRHIKIVTADWLWLCAERWEKVDERLYPVMGCENRSSRHPPAHCSSPEHSPNREIPNPKVPQSNFPVPNDRFMDSINPLMSFSSEDIATMAGEVEDILGSSESDSEEKTVGPSQVIETLAQSQDSSNSSSSSGDSLTGENVRGWCSRKRRREATDTEVDADIDDEEEESLSTKFRRGEALPSDLDLGDGDDDDSVGSDEPPDEISDGDWNMLGAALEKEFLEGD
ncbi:unnamed protein product [Bemisia tabaci]|uniref:RNA polymerase II subunit A C-terminal domain phosphatase n=1 Tax=Bemisia tabaci TaxID=7038 RepID=A0A9P0AHG4_BEMTA|nr:unnamed protein product [Bemisia tabaci]